jgi:hypothetical protein
MERGFVADNLRHSQRRVAEWFSGEPKPSFWFGVSTRGSQRHPMAAYRCPRCGLLELYAREDT